MNNYTIEKKDGLFVVKIHNPRATVDFTDQLKDDLEEMIPDGLRLGHRDQFSFEPGIIVTNVHQVKGLEFDAVCIVEPSEENYPQTRPESRNMLYVAITRAEDELMLIGTKPFARIL